MFLAPHLNLTTIVTKVRDIGYHFVDRALTEKSRAILETETKKLILEVGNHVDYPINAGAKNEVRQLHERAYLQLGDTTTPATNELCYGLAKAINHHHELSDWLPNELGYQRYRGSKDWISPHRDRRSDRLFSVTFTITGSARVNIYTSTVDPPDYKHLTLIDSWLTKPGTAMFLRAPGLGSGEQIIHEVCPPIDGERLILNLRMRPSILKQPGHLMEESEGLTPEERETLIRGGFDLEPPQWVTCPKDWRKRYRDYMKRRKIPYLERRSGKTLWFVISRKYRPHRWKL